MRLVNYRDCKHFKTDRCRTDLLSKLGKGNIEEKETGLNNLMHVKIIRCPGKWISN